MSQVQSLAMHDSVLGYEATDEVRHQPFEDITWQESACIYWGDGNGLGGAVYIGQEMNAGTANIFASAYSPNLAFRRCHLGYPLDNGSGSEKRHVAGPYAMESVDGKTIIRMEDEGISLELLCEDFAPYPSLLPVQATLGDPTITGRPMHYQASGRVRGAMKLGSEVHQIDGVATRGHSWGVGDFNVLRGGGSPAAASRYGAPQHGCAGIGRAAIASSRARLRMVCAENWVGTADADPQTSSRIARGPSACDYAV